MGIKAIVVAVSSEKLDKTFVGREYNMEFINSLPPNVDPCGENGEFHSFVYDGPIFKKQVPIELGEVVYKDYSNGEEAVGYDTGFYFQDLILSK